MPAEYLQVKASNPGLVKLLRYKRKQLPAVDEAAWQENETSSCGETVDKHYVVDGKCMFGRNLAFRVMYTQVQISMQGNRGQARNERD
jgi:hypothetical protein